MVYFSESINTLAATNWSSFSRQQYFDSQGLFISVMFSVPILLNCMILIVRVQYILIGPCHSIKHAGIYTFAHSVRFAGKLALPVHTIDDQTEDCPAEGPAAPTKIHRRQEERMIRLPHNYWLKNMLCIIKGRWCDSLDLGQVLLSRVVGSSHMHSTDNIDEPHEIVSYWLIIDFLTCILENIFGSK